MDIGNLISFQRIRHFLYQSEAIIQSNIGRKTYVLRLFLFCTSWNTYFKYPQFTYVLLDMIISFLLPLLALQRAWEIIQFMSFIQGLRKFPALARAERQDL